MSSRQLPAGLRVAGSARRAVPFLAAAPQCRFLPGICERVELASWSDSQPFARFAPTFAFGAGSSLQNFTPSIIAGVAFAPLGRGLHYISPGAVGFWSPTLGVILSTDPNARQARDYLAGELGLRYVRWPAYSISRAVPVPRSRAAKRSIPL